MSLHPLKLFWWIYTQISRYTNSTIKSPNTHCKQQMEYTSRFTTNTEKNCVSHFTLAYSQVILSFQNLILQCFLSWTKKGCSRIKKAIKWPRPNIAPHKKGLPIKLRKKLFQPPFWEFSFSSSKSDFSIFF